jgi:hypothetical protein
MNPTNYIILITVNAECATRQKNTQNIMVRDAQRLRHLNTLTDTISGWLHPPDGV